MRPPRPSAVVLWAAVQCLPLLAASAGVRIWPHQPDPPESLALAELVAVQIVAAALLFPLVLADGPTLVVNLALTLPLMQLAGLMSAARQSTIFQLTAFTGLWLVGLSGWAQLGRSDLARSCASAAAMLLTLGSALLWYVRVEAAAQAGTPNPDPARYGPLLAGIRLTVTPATICGWTFDLIPLGTCLLRLLWVQRQSRSLPLLPTQPSNGCS